MHADKFNPIVHGILLEGTRSFCPERNPNNQQEGYLLCNRTVHPMGARGILLKSCCPFMYAWADIVGIVYIGCNIFNVFSACDNKQTHKCMGKVLSTPRMTAWKWSLNVLIVFLLCFFCVCSVLLCLLLLLLCHQIF